MNNSRRIILNSSTYIMILNARRVASEIKIISTEEIDRVVKNIQKYRNRNFMMNRLDSQVDYQW